jgi:hypothetical protein
MGVAADQIVTGFWVCRLISDVARSRLALLQHWLIPFSRSCRFRVLFCRARSFFSIEKTTTEYTMLGCRGAAPQPEFGGGRRHVRACAEAFYIRQGRCAMAWRTNAITALPTLEKIDALGFSLFREWYVSAITTQRHPQDTHATLMG